MECYEINEQVKEAINLLSKVIMQVKSISINELIRLFRLTLSCNVQSTQDYYDYRFKVISHHLGKFTVSLLLPEDIISYLNKRSKECSTATVKHEYFILNRLFNFAVKNSYAHYNIMVKVPAINLPAKDFSQSDFYFTPKDIERLIESATPYLQEIITVIAHTGIRKGELAHLRIQDIDFNRNVIIIQQQNNWKPKNGTERIIPMDSTVRLILERKIESMIESQQYIFVSTSGGKVYNYGHSVYQLLKRTGFYNQIPTNVKKGVHFLRHSFCSYLINDCKIELSTVQEILGHRDIKTTRQYIHTDIFNKRKAIDNFEHQYKKDK